LNNNSLSEDISNIFFSKNAITYLPYYSDDEINNIYIKLLREWLNDKNQNVLNKKISIFNLLKTFFKEVLIELENEPYCKYKHFLRWREISHIVGEDIFTTSFLAHQDLMSNHNRTYFSWKPIISSDNSRLKKILQKGVAENHFHLGGSGPHFDISWISLMNKITFRYSEFKELGSYKLQQEVIHQFSGQSSELYALVKKAATIRFFLFNYLKNGDPTFSYLKENLINILKPLSIEKNSIVTDLYLSEVQKEIDLFKFVFGRKFKSNNEVITPDYAIPKNITEENFNGNVLLYGERYFLYSIFKKIFQNKVKQLPLIKDMFYAYLVIKNKFAEELVQLNGNIGFGNFKKYQDRKSIFTRTSPFFEKAIHNMAIKTSILNQNIISLEARLIPTKKTDTLIKLLETIDSNISDNLFCKSNNNFIDLWLNNQSKDHMINYDKFFYTLHFTKRKDNCKSYELAEWLIPRSFLLRNDIKQRALAVIGLQESFYSLKKRVYGIDAASEEIGCRPEVLSQAFRFLKNHKITDKYDYILDKRNNHKLYATFHVGEDFLDIVDGLRAIDEAIKFCNLTVGDRLGHATAIGIDVEEYYKFKKFKLLIPKQDLLDNIVWILSKIREFDIEDNSMVEVLQKLYNNLFYEIYGKHDRDLCNTPHTIYYDAWKLRGDDPYLYLDGYFNERNRTATTFWDRCSINSRCPDNSSIRYNQEITKIYSAYHFNRDIKESGKQIFEFKVEFRYIDLVKKIQFNLQKQIGALNIGIETNPTSNYLIGTFNRYDKHPILNLYNLGLTYDFEKLSKSNQMFVSINTDDQGVFETYLENEYTLMAIALEKAKDENGKLLYNQAMIYDWLDRIRQMGIEMSFKNDWEN
ncbi:MAG: hypothetical protein JXR48_02875, partial [Candidatus Delongbacteria bacterium]|nr:hypothetical protein [Candidatus Delongbacteria bacterium]